jgi:hypothetical protein
VKLEFGCKQSQLQWPQAQLLFVQTRDNMGTHGEGKEKKERIPKRNRLGSVPVLERNQQNVRGTR